MYRVIWGMTYQPDKVTDGRTLSALIFASIDSRKFEEIAKFNAREYPENNRLYEWK